MLIVRTSTEEITNLKLSQTEYVKKVHSSFNVNEAKPVSTPLDI